MQKKAYLEITNACNLSCSFCHGTRRPIHFLTREEFTHAAAELRPFSDFLYFHLMGEPLLHPLLRDFLAIAGELGFRVILTTNGCLLPRQTETLLAAPALYKVSVSLHSFEANGDGQPGETFDRYLDGCLTFCRQASAQGVISVLRLWNIGGEDALNRQIIERMHTVFDPDGTEWRETYSGLKIRDKLYLEWGERFDWPDLEADYCGNTHACYGLRDQVGVLSDGTVVPCCLDADGVIALGNIFRTPLAEILASPRAQALKKSFENRNITEPLCQRCGFAHSKGF